MKIKYNGKNLGYVLKSLRRALDMNQSLFVNLLKAKNVRISVSSISKYEANFISPFSEYSFLISVRDATKDICDSKGIQLIVDDFTVTNEDK